MFIYKIQKNKTVFLVESEGPWRIVLNIFAGSKLDRLGVNLELRRFFVELV